MLIFMYIVFNFFNPIIDKFIAPTLKKSKLANKTTFARVISFLVIKITNNYNYNINGVDITD